MTDQDTLPWYRQFWPWFLIVLPGSAVVASLYTVSLAVRSGDSLVVSDDAGMDVVAERHRAAERRADALGIAANLEIDAASGAVTAVLSSHEPAPAPAALALLLSHPTMAARDATITLAAAIPDPSGRPAFAGHFVGVPSGRFYVVLTPAGDVADDWRLTGVWSGEPRLRLLPAGRASDEPD